MAIRIVCAEAQRKVTGKTEIEGSGKIKKHRLEIEKGAAQTLSIAG